MQGSQSENTKNHVNQLYQLKKYTFRNSPRAACRAAAPTTIGNHISCPCAIWALRFVLRKNADTAVPPMTTIHRTSSRGTMEMNYTHRPSRGATMEAMCELRYASCRESTMT